MVDDNNHTTLFEGWGIGKDGFGGGSTNHAWSGGGLTILSQYVCGLEPIEPAWTKFRIKPQLGGLEYAEAYNETVAGKVGVKVAKINGRIDMEVIVPYGSEAVIYIPNKNKEVQIGNKKVTSNEKDGNYTLYQIKGGEYKITAR